MKKLTAIKESIVIWEELARCGFQGRYFIEGSKGKVVDELFSKKLLRQSHYHCGCPLCELYNQNENYCENCPWPGNGEYRCLDGAINLYKDWMRANGDEDRKQVARSIVVLLKHLRDREAEK